MEDTFRVSAMVRCKRPTPVYNNKARQSHKADLKAEQTKYQQEGAASPKSIYVAGG